MTFINPNFKEIKMSEAANKKKTLQSILNYKVFSFVPKAGIEPARYC